MIVWLYQRLVAMGLRVVILTSRLKLVKQLIDEGIDIGIPRSELQKAISTPIKHSNKLERWAKGLSGVPPADVYMFDECHHLLAPTWAAPLAQRLPSQRNPLHVGWTATALRGLQHETSEWRHHFDRLHTAITMAEAMRRGYLVPFSVPLEYCNKFTPQAYKSGSGRVNEQGRADRAMASTVFANLDAIWEDIATNFSAQPRPSLIAAPTLRAAERITAMLNERGRELGIRAESLVGSEREANEHDRVMAAFKNGACNFLVGVDMILEGFDFPGIQAIYCLRNCVAPGPVAQLIGRGVRVFRDKHTHEPLWHVKSDFVFYDYPGNVLRFTETFRDYLGISLLERDGRLEPNLIEQARPERLKVEGDSTSFRYQRTESRWRSGWMDGELVQWRLAHALFQNNWVLDWKRGNEEGSSLLQGHEWVSRVMPCTPVDFRLTIDGRLAPLVNIAQRLAADFDWSPSDEITLGDVLGWIWMQQVQAREADQHWAESGYAPWKAGRHLIDALARPKFVLRISRASS